MRYLDLTLPDPADNVALDEALLLEAEAGYAGAVLRLWEYPAPVVVQQSPPVYTERQDAAPAPEAQSYWYYCAATRGYYPYVKECPGGWQKVAPAPQN